jgi:glycosyltransferase involved in cell wall biosynthesis
MAPAAIRLTVIVPVRNEERRIGRCLESILQNDFDLSEMEILVVDGCSTDRSRDIALERAASCGNFKILQNPAKIVSAALNIGIRNARGEVIIIMGAHAEYSPNYISTCLHVLDVTGADAVGGILETRPGGQSTTAQAIAVMSQHRFGVGGSAFRTSHDSGYVDTVPYGAYRREIFEKLGLFNEQLVRNQDFEFNARVRKAGGKLFLSTNIRAAYYNVADLRSLSRQAFNNGRWLPAMWLSSPATMRLRHAVPAFFVGVLTLAIVFGILQRSFSFFGMLVFALYAIAAAITAASVACTRGRRLFIPLVSAFCVQHFAYGAGTLVGVVACMRPSVVLRIQPQSTSTQP